MVLYAFEYSSTNNSFRMTDGQARKKLHLYFMFLVDSKHLKLPCCQFLSANRKCAMAHGWPKSEAIFSMTVLAFLSLKNRQIENMIKSGCKRPEWIKYPEIENALRPRAASFRCRVVYLVFTLSIFLDSSKLYHRVFAFDNISYEKF